MGSLPLIDIHYLRLPNQEHIFSQYLIWEDINVKITFASNLDFELPMLIDGEVVLEKGSEIIWFTFPGAWHDIGLFHGSNGILTGTYANILTPCVFEDISTWHTTDLFLDVWIDTNGKILILDEEELKAAEAQGWITEKMAARARSEALSLKRQAESGLWPPAVVHEWDLVRARKSIP
mgnify:CR=1 FL=1|tara:strand:- start:3675 stop:4208 length:534 start_codon:yes stop_codon:yes gene_type:complete